VINEDVIMELMAKFKNHTGENPVEITLHNSNPIAQATPSPPFNIAGMNISAVGWIGKDEAFLASESGLHVHYRVAIVVVSDNYSQKRQY
jgi:hypothetical protein